MRQNDRVHVRMKDPQATSGTSRVLLHQRTLLKPAWKLSRAAFLKNADLPKDFQSWIRAFQP